MHTVSASNLNVLPGILSSTSSELKESRSNMNVKSGVLTIGGYMAQSVCACVIFLNSESDNQPENLCTARTVER